MRLGQEGSSSRYRIGCLKPKSTVHHDDPSKIAAASRPKRGARVPALQHVLPGCGGMARPGSRRRRWCLKRIGTRTPCPSRLCGAQSTVFPDIDGLPDGEAGTGKSWPKCWLRLSPIRNAAVLVLLCPAIEHEGYRAIVDQLDLHHRAELSLLSVCDG